MSVPDGAGRQQAFASWLRNPEGPPPAGIDARRGALYRRLFFNNVTNLLSTFFPLTRSLYAPDGWHALAADFFARHRAGSPYFLDIAREFLDFLVQERGEHPGDPPCLRDLAHYEWLELVLDVAEEELPVAGIDPQGDLLAAVPVLNPVAVLATYAWPVHRVVAGEPLPPAEETFLLGWRDPSGQVRFMALNSATARLYAQLRASPAMTGREAALAVAGATAHPDPAAVLAGAADMLRQWRERHILLGTQA